MSGKDAGKEPIRPQQVASVLRRAIQEILARGLADPRFQGIVTVTHVDCSPDLKQATVYVSVMPVERQSLALHALKHATGYIRRECGQRMAINALPNLIFKVDTEIKKQVEVLDALAKVAREREEKERAAAPRTEPGAAPGDGGEGAA